MASRFALTTGKVTLTAASTKSLWLLDPVTNDAVITQIDVSMDASALVAGVQFDLYKVTTIGTPAGTAPTIDAAVTAPAPAFNRLYPQTAAPTTTVLANLSAEPTAVAVVLSWYLQPTGGLYTLQWPLGREPKMVGGGARWGLRYTTPASVTPDCIANVTFEE